MADGASRLAPGQALAYLHELSVDLRAGLVLGSPDGAVQAGPESLADPARALLAAAGEARVVDVEAGEGRVVAVRGAAHTLVLVLGRHVLPELARWDAEHVLAGLEGLEMPDPGTPEGTGARAEPAVIAAATALSGAAMALRTS